MKSFVLAASLVLTVSIVIACAAPPPAPPVTGPSPVPEVKESRESWQQKWDSLVAGAKKEGEMTIYATIGADTVKQLTSAFKEKYSVQPGFLTMQRGPEMTERIFRERSAGLYLVDIVLVGTTTLAAVMKPAGILEPLDTVIILPEALEPRAWRGGSPYMDKDHKIAPVAGAFLRYVVRNTELVKEGEIKNFDDLLAPKWKGKIVINDPTQTGAGNSWMALMAETWGLERTRDYLKQLAKQEPLVTRDTRLQAEWVARGKYALGIAVRPEIAGEFLSLGAPIAFVKTAEGGNIAGSVTLGVPDKRPHPAAAAVFANWLLTRDGMSTFMKGFRAPVVRQDISFEGINPIFLPDPGEPVYTETEESIPLKATVLLDMAKEVLGPLMK